MSTTHDRGEVLEALFDLGGTVDDRDALAARAGLPAAEVGAVLDALVDADLVERGHASRVALTPAGTDAAITYVRRHRLAERLLRDVIGLDWWKVHHEAESWEGVISDEVEARLVRLLGDPGTCPHGNPIPGSANRPDQSAAVRLMDATEGAVQVVRITEDLEEDDEALRLLEGCGFIPGRPAEVAGRETDGSVRVVGPVADALLPPHVAQRTYVLQGG